MLAFNFQSTAKPYCLFSIHSSVVFKFFINQGFTHSLAREANMRYDFHKLQVQVHCFTVLHFQSTGFMVLFHLGSTENFTHAVKEPLLFAL